MSENINVSVIFATYNRSDVIEDVLKQWLVVDKSTKYSYEIICSDDASSDNTVDIIKKFKGLPITILKNRHGGASKARNAALKRARGEIIIFTGDDIFPTPDFVNKHYENYLKYGDKMCTLGRIEWHEDVELNQLMYHITNIGCEQFGFAGLIPHAIADFRHFYTSNISVSRKELENLGKNFDLTFDRYGFEDIELGYRLHKNGVKIYYDPDLLAYHHHIYNDVDKFCNRQMSAGDQLVVFTKLHKELRYNEIMQIYKFEDAIKEYTGLPRGYKSEFGEAILAYTQQCKERTRELERLIKAENNREHRAECTALYRYIFQFSMYMGWGSRLTRGEKLDKSVVAEAAFRYMYEIEVQLFWADQEYFNEENSTRFYLKDKRITLKKSVQGVSRFRLDPCNRPCKISDLKAVAIKSDTGEIVELELVGTNGIEPMSLDFTTTDDPQLVLGGLNPDTSYDVEISFNFDGVGSVEQVLQHHINDELVLGRTYDRPVFQTRKLNLCFVNKTEKDISDSVSEYKEFITKTYGNEIIVSDEVTELDFRSNYVFEIGETPITTKELNMVILDIYYNHMDGIVTDRDMTVHLTSLTDKAMSELPIISLDELSKKYPLLSVVIPSYNHQQYIGKAIDSVLNQSYPNMELIIIDDGSRDDSINLIKSYKDERLTLVCQENAGAHNAINRGLEMAKGDYLAILNSDDIYDNRRFEVMMDEMLKNPQVDFACSYIHIIDTYGNKLGVKEGWRNMEPWVVPHPEKSFKATNDFALNLIMTNFTSTTSNFLFTKRLYNKIGGMRNLRFAHDWDFALRAAENSECIIIEKPLMEYRVHNTNTISSNRKWMLFEIAWMWVVNMERFYGSKLFCDDSMDDIFRVAESLNTQGNDKVFWMIKMFIDLQRSKGIEKPEEILLDNAELRNQFIEFIVE